MRRIFPIIMLMAGIWTGPSLMAGSISGVVRAQGKEGMDADAGGSNYGSKAFKTAERVNYDEMRDFVVYIKGPMEGAKPTRAVEQIRQKNASFVPHVLPIMVGTSVEFPNDDSIFHNVFSKSD